MSQHPIQREVRGVLLFVGTLWIVYLLNALLPGDFNSWGLIPRRIAGLPGIVLMPFLHASLSHLLSNTVPLIVLLLLMAGSRTATWRTVTEIILLGGALLWVFGRNGSTTEPLVHVGASGLVYGLIAFLIVAGFRERRIIPLLVALLVGFLYGGTLLTGILPTTQAISWDGHLTGGIAGAVLGYFVPAKATSADGSKEESPEEFLRRHGIEL